MIARSIFQITLLKFLCLFMLLRTKVVTAHLLFHVVMNRVVLRRMGSPTARLPVVQSAAAVATVSLFFLKLQVVTKRLGSAQEVFLQQ